MRIAAMGDLHLRNTIPRGRSDDYCSVLINKFRYILDTCDKHGIEYLIQPGDFFDSVLPSIDLIRQTALLLRSHKVKILIVYGQHDLRFHAKDTSNTPLRLLEDFGLVTRLSPVAPVKIGKVAIYGSSWKEEEPKNLSDKCVNIWATHRLVTDSDKLWPGAENYTLAQHLLRINKFHLIITGDNHKAFVTKFATRWLVNCGSLGRTNIDQAAHVPFFVVFDTETRKLARIRAPIRPPKEVLKVEEVKVRKQKEAELARFIEGLKSAKLQKGINYKAMVLDALEQINNDNLTLAMKKIFIAAESKDKILSLGDGFGANTRQAFKEQQKREKNENNSGSDK